jgi:hypothetical protein
MAAGAASLAAFGVGHEGCWASDQAGAGGFDAQDLKEAKAILDQ